MPIDIAMGGRSLLTPRTGIGQYVQHLARGLAEQGHGVRYFYGTHWSCAQESEQPSSAPVRARGGLVGVARRLARKHAPGLARFAPLLEQARFNAGIHGHRRPQIYHEPNFIPPRCPCPSVVTVHDVSWVRYPEYHPTARLAFLRAHFPAALARTDRVIVVSEFVRQELLACYAVDPGKIRVVHNGVSAAFTPLGAEHTRAVLDKHGLVHERYLAVVGTLEPRKNLTTVLAAHAQLPYAMQRAYPLVLAGVEGWLTEALHGCLRVPVQQGTVRLLGYVPDAEVPKLIAGACALLYPSVYEGFGLPPLEAMACGVPVIASQAAAVKEVVGAAGLLNDAFDVNAFAQSMQRVIEDASLRRQLSESGCERARHFSWQRAVHETLAVYRDLLD